MATKCHATNAAGSPCQAMPLKGGEYCAWHDPDLAERRKEWSVAGGKGKSNTARARKRLTMLDLDDIDAALCRAMLDVLDGTLEPGIATAAATVARTISSVRSATQFEQRLAALEALDRQSQRKGWSA